MDKRNKNLVLQASFIVVLCLILVLKSITLNDDKNAGKYIWVTRVFLFILLIWLVTRLIKVIKLVKQSRKKDN